MLTNLAEQFIRMLYLCVSAGLRLRQCIGLPATVQSLLERFGPQAGQSTGVPLSKESQSDRPRLAIATVWHSCSVWASLFNPFWLDYHSHTLENNSRSSYQSASLAQSWQGHFTGQQKKISRVLWQLGINHHQPAQNA